MRQTWRTILYSLIVIVLSLSAIQCRPGSGSNGSGNNGGGDKSGKGWRVWVRTEPCSGRFDWLSVSKDPIGAGTGAGKNVYVPYDTVMANQGCTGMEPVGCTFEEANALMEKLRGDPKFFDYCCRDYSVWENTETKAKRIVAGKFGTAGYGFSLVKGDLCCEEAEALAGIPGACSGSSGGHGGGSSDGGGSDLEFDTDRPGQDFRNFDLPEARPQLCQAECGSDPRCKAFTYVKPGIQGPSARCYLKSTVPAPVKSSCCISGISGNSGSSEGPHIQMKECENSGAEICGTWNVEGRQISASWSNGAVATMQLERFDTTVIITRNDTSGVSKGLTARYEGRRTGNRIEGTVTWSWNGKTWNGTWNASW